MWHAFTWIFVSSSALCFPSLLEIISGEGDPTGAAYADVHLSDRGKEVALLLSVDDWNYEVVYWLLNFWSNSETMKVGDVRGGNLPFSDVSKFKEMNERIGRLARILGEEGGAALEKKGKKYSGKNSVKEVLSGMIKIVTEDHDIVEFTRRARWMFEKYEGDEYCLPDSVKKADVAEPFWSFVCDSFAGYVVEVCALTCLLDIREMTAKGTNQNNLMIATSILLYNNNEQGEKITEAVVDILLQCGAKPGRCHAIGNYKNKTALHAAAKISDKDVGIKVAQALLSKCDEQSISEFVNAADERGRTALHIASEKGYAAFCGVLVDGGASVTAQDKKGMTALHYAAKGEFDEVIDVLVESPHVSESLELTDNRGYTPLDIAVKKNNYEVNREFVKQLPSGDCDQEGKTALHLAAMCDNDSDAIEMISLLIDPETPDLENMVSKQDKRGRTALHEAALNGYAILCDCLLCLNPELIHIKDRDGRNPLYDVLQVEYKDRKPLYDADNEEYKLSLSMKLLDAYLKTDRPGVDLMDSSRRTLLHIAASQGKAEFVHELLSRSKIKEKLLRRADIRAQTALHMAVKRGEKDMVKILLEHGAHPLRERDCDGRTAFHYAVRAETEHKMELASILLEESKLHEEEKLLLLCASASGVATADRDLSKDDPLYKLLVDKRKGIEKDSKLEKFGGNLLKMAASLGDIEMSKELITGGYQIGDLRDSGWMSSLDNPNQNNVHKVLIHIDMIREQGNDKPAISDSLGRLDYAHGLAALFLNPYIKPPIAVGITGSWGMGKSSLMLQSERILLTTAAQMSLLQSSKLSNSELESPDLQLCESSRVGKRKCEHIYRQVNYAERVKNIFLFWWDKIRGKIQHNQEEVEKFLNEYDLKYLKIFQKFTAMDNCEMLESNASRLKTDPSAEEKVPSVLTVQYNAWKYRDDTEALAGIAVEITKELEGIMTLPQWLSICWRNTWRQNKYAVWTEIFFPFLVTQVLVCSLTWIVWVVFDNDKLKEWGKAKYAWPPAAAVITVWTITKSIMGILKPVSTQLMQYISFPDHTDKLGYQERVISDISFLKEQIGKKAHRVFIFLCWDSGSNLRIIVFVDDLDRCVESVILKVLSAVNLVLGECKISVVIGMDKRLIDRAIIKKFENANTKANQELADMYLQKIIQLPLDLPDPSAEESKRFSRGQLGVVENENIASTKDDRNSSNGGAKEAVQQNIAAQHTINMHTPSEITETGHTNLEERRVATESPLQTNGKQKPSSYILIKEMLFVRYSKGEEDRLSLLSGVGHRVQKTSSRVEAPSQLPQIGLEFMNLVIKKWKEIGDLKMKAPSLLKIVKHLIEERDKENRKTTSCEEDNSKSTVDFLNSENGSAEKLTNGMEQKHDALEKSLAELKKEMKQFKDVISDELKKDIKELKEQVSDELKNHIREMKEQMVGMESGNSEESWEIEKKN
ncbi:hypothetical protein SUGI_0409340 [Cryptomeria japonica]|nr:hypothetical protein SUGI_0409340 [Cryptomeria japonica]